MHQRILIRRAVRDKLIAANTPAGTRVVPTRIVSWRPNELPAISIYTLSESVDESSAETAPRELTRRPKLIIECALKMTDAFVAANSNNIDDALDEFALMVERAISVDYTLGGTVSDVWLSDTDIDILEKGDQLIGVISLTFSPKYYSYFPDAADVPLDNFSTADIRHSLANAVNVDNQAHDVVSGLDV